MCVASSFMLKHMQNQFHIRSASEVSVCSGKLLQFLNFTVRIDLLLPSSVWKQNYSRMTTIDGNNESSPEQFD